MTGPLLIVSAARGYGGAERDIEILVRHISPSRRFTVLANSPYHLERLRATDRRNMDIVELELAGGPPFDRAVRRFIQAYLTLRPQTVLANTLDSLCILSEAASLLPGLDARSFVFVRDFQWTNYEEALARLPRATLLVPDRTVLERPNYLGRFAQPDGPFRALQFPSPVEIPAATPVDPSPGAPFLHLATVNRMKGHHRLADAVALLKGQGADVCVISCGHRPELHLLEALETHVAMAGVADRLELRDHVADPDPLLRSCAAVLVTTTSSDGGPETFGRTIVEAWAHGRPVIAFAVGAPRHLIRHEVDGLLVAENDVAGLANAMLRLHQDPALAIRLGRAGHERVRTDFDARLVVPWMLAVLDGGWRFPLAAPGAHRPAPVMQRVLLDVTLILANGWHAPVGMSRVGDDIAEYLCRDPAFDVQLICKGEGDGEFRRLSPLELEFLVHRADAHGRQAADELAASPAPEKPPAPGRMRCLALAVVLRIFGWRVAGTRPVRRWLQGGTNPAICRTIAIPGPRLMVEPGDILVSSSNPWDYAGPESFRRLRATGAHFVLVVHDLMVWETPHLTAGRDPQAYSRDMLAVVAEADRIVAVSTATAKSIDAAFASLERSPPPVVVAHPPAGFAAVTAVDCPASGIDASRPFVLFCSTIEVRKNHILLLHLWERLRTTLPADRLPQLVFAGRWGWGVDAVRLMVERNWRLAPHICVLGDVRDDVLHWLYRNARFTLFPSLAEGFGMPVSESLSMGTPVLISDLPALREASENTMPALDPCDLPAWQREVTALCLDDARLEALRAKARTYRGPRPGELAEAVVAAVRSFGAAPNTRNAGQ